VGRSRASATGSGRGSGPAPLILTRLAREATRLSRPVAFDTSALIAYLDDREPAASLLFRLFEDPDVAVVLSTISVAEVLTLPARHDDRAFFEEVYRAISGLPGLHIAPLDVRTATETARVRAQTELKLPDAAIIATARLSNAIAIIGNDRRWRSRPLGLPYVHLNDLVGEIESDD
jgi:predicted nucleic acid-binding protein